MGIRIRSLLRTFSRDRGVITQEAPLEETPVIVPADPPVEAPTEPPPNNPDFIVRQTEKVGPVNKIVLDMEDKAYAYPPADKMVTRSRNKGKARKAKE